MADSPGLLLSRCRLWNRTVQQTAIRPQTTGQSRPLSNYQSCFAMLGCTFDAPFPIFVLATPFPLMRSHILRALSFPTLSATLPEGCTATELTRPLCPFRARRTDQSLALNRHRVPSSEADSKWDRDGNSSCVIEPLSTRQYMRRG